jgi:hypothetical protein
LRRNVTKEEFKARQRDRKIESTLNEREKSPHERELLRYLQEERQKVIKQHLDLYNKQRAGLFWKTQSMKQKQILAQPSMFVGRGNIL